MGKKRPPPPPPALDNPPSASSEETNQPSESDSQSQPESEDLPPPPPRLKKQDSDSDIDSDIKSPSVSNFKVKPSKKITTPEKKPAKKKAKLSQDDEKKSSSVVKKVWSEEDELNLVQCFIDYRAKNGCAPSSDMDRFYQYLMEFLPGNSRSQLYEKIRRLKKKFQQKLENPVFVKPHDRKLFDISNAVWGVNGCDTVGNANGLKAKGKDKAVVKVDANGSKAKTKDKVEVKVEAKAETIDFETLYPYWNAGFNLDGPLSFNFPKGVVGLFRKELGLIDEAICIEMNEKWKGYFEKEAALKKNKNDLLNEVRSR